MRVMCSLCMSVCMFFTFQAIAEDMAKCSIKAEVSCSGPLLPDDTSYTFRLGKDLDTEKVLHAQLDIYKQLHEKLEKHPFFPIYVDVETKMSYEDSIKSHRKEFLKFPLQYRNIMFFPSFYRRYIYEQIQVSRVEIPVTAYSESELLHLKEMFPTEIHEGSLTDEQKQLIVKDGVLAILIAQGYAKNVHLKTKKH